MKKIITVIKILVTAALWGLSLQFGFIGVIMMIASGINSVMAFGAMIVLPALITAAVWLKRTKRFWIIWGVIAAVCVGAVGINYAAVKYEESLRIDTSPNINVHEYLPFEEDSKIVKMRSENVQLKDRLPVIDGAAALFPVYSGFVNATYPEGTKLNEGSFVYNNTKRGYELLAQKQTDIFIGAYPGEEQRSYAEECGTNFTYTEIGKEAFVFFVHKNNPVNELTADEIKGIYSGEITNWKEVGGKDEEIIAFQRNEGSGSQSMMKRFMGDTPLMQPPTEMVNDLMSGIIEQVADYRSSSSSIGFSFRFYVEGIIKNPDIKMIAVDGVKPEAENVRNETYPIITPVYAVSYEGNENENVQILLDWFLSEEGQYIVEKTGYVGVK